MHSRTASCNITERAWCLLVVLLLAVLSRGSGFVFERLSGISSIGRPSQAAGCGAITEKHEVDKGSRWVGGLPPAIAVRGGGGRVQEVASQSELEEVLSGSPETLVVIDFTATWCGPCQRIAPEYEQLSEELTDVVFLKVDVDENEETAQEYEVNQMPTFLLIKNGEVVDQFSGANIDVLRQKIDGLS